MDGVGLGPAADGFVFSAFKGADFMAIVADPEPGVTGWESAVLHLQISSNRSSAEVRFVPTPGAAEGNRRMWTKVLAAGAEAVNALIEVFDFKERGGVPVLLLPYLESSDPQVVDVLLRTLGDGQGGVSLQSMQTGGANFVFGDGSVRLVMAGLTTKLRRALQLGVNGENWNVLPAVQVPGDVSPWSEAFFNLQTAKTLTAYYIADATMAKTLVRYLERAEQAGERGDEAVRQRWLDNYVAVLQKVRGALLPAVQAETLIRLVQAM
jgi:prepilin-type processing-associated H-X9-DG protein